MGQWSSGDLGSLWCHVNGISFQTLCLWSISVLCGFFQGLFWYHIVHMLHQFQEDMKPSLCICFFFFPSLNTISLKCYSSFRRKTGSELSRGNDWLNILNLLVTKLWNLSKKEWNDYFFLSFFLKYKDNTDLLFLEFCFLGVSSVWI